MTKLIMLGTGTPNVEPNRFQSSLAIVVDDQPYIIDCGGGTLQRIAQAGLKLSTLTRLFLTHLHPDHTTGLPDFIIVPWVESRSETLQIYGPAGTQMLCDSILQGYAIGIGEHRDGLAPINHPLNVEVTEIDTGSIYQDERITVEAFKVQHGGLDAFGYKFVTEDKTIVISGDTCPTDTLIEHATGCDILVHEVYSAETLKTRPENWQAYHTTVHTSTTELAKIANEVQPGLLVLTHQLLWGTTPDNLVNEIKAHYKGRIIYANDLDSVE